MNNEQYRDNLLIILNMADANRRDLSLQSELLQVSCILAFKIKKKSQHLFAMNSSDALATFVTFLTKCTQLKASLCPFFFIIIIIIICRHATFHALQLAEGSGLKSAGLEPSHNATQAKNDSRVGEPWCDSTRH